MTEPGLNTPRGLGFKMPAEWHPHDCTWLSWPKDPVTWPDRVPQAQQTFIEMINFLTQGETVRLLVDDEETQSVVASRLSETVRSKIIFHQIPTVDAWIRDYGPNFLTRGSGSQVELAFNDWDFNAWGDKYEDLKLDSVIPSRIAEILKVRSFKPGIVLEGGSIDVNGAGCCLTTEQCLLNPNRNPSMDRASLEATLRDYLGVETVIWLSQGIEGDDTDGHIDDIARFVDPQTIVCMVEEDPRDPNYDVLMDNWRRLEEARDASGRPFRLIRLPMPEAVEAPDGRLPASYANFYIANQAVLVPVFGRATDEKALETLREVFPKRRVVGINCRDLVWGMGAIHCVTQQQPSI